MKVKVPQNVRIGSFDYEIVSVPHLISDYRLLGQSLTEAQVIKIDPDTTLQTKAQVIWHEILHGISEVYGCGLDDSNIDRMAQGIASTLESDFGIELDWSELEL